jgi:putative transposase
VPPSAVWRVRRNAGIDPASGRDGPGRAGFLRSRARGILALDFAAGLRDGTKICVLAVIGHGTRRVRVLRAAGHPVRARVVWQARNLLTGLEDAGRRVKFVLHGRDAGRTAPWSRQRRYGNCPTASPAWISSGSSAAAAPGA